MGDPDRFTEEGPIEEVKAVCTHPFDPGAAKTIPKEVKPRVFAIEAAAFRDDEEEEQESNEIPEAFVEERRMDVNELGGTGP